MMPTCFRLRHLSLLLLLVLCLPLAARADDASHRAKAAQMVVLLHTEGMVQQASASILKQYSDAAEKAAGPNPTPQSKAQIADFEKKASQMIDAQVGWSRWNPPSPISTQSYLQSRSWTLSWPSSKRPKALPSYRRCRKLTNRSSSLPRPGLPSSNRRSIKRYFGVIFNAEYY